MNRTDLQALSNTRMRESKILLNAQEYSGAYYLAGYSIECALKACIAKGTRQHDFPDKDRALKSYSHRPLELMKVADLYDDLQSAMRSDLVLARNWTIVTEWSEQSRYETWSGGKATALLMAASLPSGGVLPWLQMRW